MSLVAHWKLDESEGLRASDSSGYGNHATLVGMSGTEWTTGTLDGALQFLGSARYVDCGNGSIDDVHIYYRALSAQEIAGL